jgi:hypothetical protein
MNEIDRKATEIKTKIPRRRFLGNVMSITAVGLLSHSFQEIYQLKQTRERLTQAKQARYDAYIMNINREQIKRFMMIKDDEIVQLKRLELKQRNISINSLLGTLASGLLAALLD